MNAVEQSIRATNNIDSASIRRDGNIITYTDGDTVRVVARRDANLDDVDIQTDQGAISVSKEVNVRKEIERRLSKYHHLR